MSKSQFGRRSTQEKQQEFHMKKMELAETIWSNLRLNDKCLPSHDEFKNISSIDCEDVIQPSMPHFKPWSTFVPNLRLHRVQAAKIFAKAWTESVEPQWGSAELAMNKNNLTTKQIFHCLRNNRDLLGGTASRYRDMQEASYTMGNCVELMNMSIRFKNKTDSNVNFTKVLEVLGEAGRMLMDTVENPLNSTCFDPTTLKLVGESCVILRYIAISEKFPAMSQNLGELDVYFRKAVRSIIEEFGERVSEQDWIKASAQDVALMSKNLVTPKCFKYIMYITVERLMFMVDTMLSDKVFEREFYDLF